MNRNYLFVFTVITWAATACGSVKDTPAADAGAPTADASAMTADASTASDGGVCDPSSCPGEDTACSTRICDSAGQCAVAFTAANTPTGSQTTGDCAEAVCDGAGNVTAVVDLNDDDDGLECTADSCTVGGPVHDNIALFTACPQTPGGVCSGLGACLTCVDDSDCFSTGSDSAFLANGGGEVELAGGTYNFTSFVIGAQTTVRVTGAQPLVIKVQGNVQIDGVLLADGQPGLKGVSGTTGSPGPGGKGVAGGGDGGDGSYHVTAGPLDGIAGSGNGGGGAGTTWGPGAGGGHATDGGAVTRGSATPGAAYSDAMMSQFAGGSGGGGGSGGVRCAAGGGGAGGGAIKIIAYGSLTIGSSGSVLARGGHGGDYPGGGGGCGGGGGGSGGSIWLRANNLSVAGSVSAVGGMAGLTWDAVGGNGAPGRVRIDGSSVSVTGQVDPVAGHQGGVWYQ